MLRTALILILGVAIGGPTAALAQDPTLPSVPQSLSLRDAIELAAEYNPGLRQTANDIAGAEWLVRNAYGSFLPRLDASGGMSFRGSGTQTFLTTEFAQPSSTIGTSYGLGLSLQFSGRTVMQPGLAKAQLRATEATIEGAQINLESTVRQQYLAVLQSEAQVALAEAQVTRNEEFLRLARARFEVGQNTQLDVRQAEVALGQAVVARLQDQQDVVVQKLTLFQLMGIPAPTDPTVVTLTDTFPITEPIWELDDLLADAADHNPDLTSLRAQASAATANEKAVKTDWLPSLSLSAGWSGFTQQFTNSDPLIRNAILSGQAQAQSSIDDCQLQNQIFAGLTSPLPPADCNMFAFTPADEQAIRDDIRSQNSVFPFDFTGQPFQASLSISLPIFTQFSRPLRVSEAAAQADDAMEFVRSRELDVRTAVSQAYYQLQAAYEAIGIQEQNRVAAAEQLRLSTERYRVGSGTFFELLDGQVAAQQAERDYINAVYAYHQAIATLESAVGRPLR